MTEHEEFRLDEEKKAVFIGNMKIIFSQIRHLMEITERNIVSEDKVTEARSFVLATNLIIYLNDFLEEMQILTRSNSH
jgi:hypothetical protein